jgi:hypothetical protein
MEEMEVGSDLLMKFKSLGTDDHETLVVQFRQLVGSEVTVETASFFLDMNNW